MDDQDSEETPCPHCGHVHSGEFESLNVAVIAMAEVIAEALEAGEMAMAVHSIGRMVDMLETAAPAVLGVMHISDPERGIVDIMDEVRSLTDEWHIRIEAKCGLVHIEEELEAGRG